MLTARTKNIISSVFNLAIYFSAGVAAPIFFREIPDHRKAGVFAGGLFMITALRALRLSLTRPYLPWVRSFFGLLFLAEFSFWGWRMLDQKALSEVFILGVPGTAFHPVMSGLYLFSCGVILYAEVRWLKNT